jgi:FlaA1/EpsC-like NDP-sugar epimerase
MAQKMMYLRNRYFLIFDAIALLLLPSVALLLRDDPLRPDYMPSLLVYSIVSAVVWIGAFLYLRLYSVYWQYAGVDEMVTVVAAVLLGAMVNLFVFFVILRPLGLVSDAFPRSVPVIETLLVLIVMVCARGSVRYMDRRTRYRRVNVATRQRVVIYGAGEAGTLIAREMLGNPQLGMEPIAFLDDDPKKHKMVIQGTPVLGGREYIGRLMREGRMDRMIIAMPTSSGKTVREISARCMDEKLPVQIVPGVYELLNGAVTVSKLRNIEIQDLLRREPVAYDFAAVSELVRGKRVLVTGAGGSIGGELCRQVAQCAPAHIVLVGHGENSIFMQAHAMRAAFPAVPCLPVIADVRDTPRMRQVMAQYRPQLVFHAAAHKHVSLMEDNPHDAVTNNVLGTRVVLDAASAHGVETFVMISTDKAVNPESIMGATKRVAELYVHARSMETEGRYVAVRFGNVLGSRGSVVPLFRQQIANGGPVQVTDPEVRRFFMTIPEAVQLVLQAAALGRGGEIFTLDMGEPIKIVDLARDLIRLSGYQVGRDIDIEFIGLRPGEKLYEELFVPGELYERTAREKIFVARNGAKPQPEQHAALYAAIDALIAVAQNGATQDVRAQLARIVPEFKGVQR